MKHRSNHLKPGPLGTCCILIAACCCMNTAAAQGVVTRPVVLTGTDGPLGPGLATGVVFTTFNTLDLGTLETATPAINGFGDTAFLATISGPGITADVNNTGIWVHRNGRLVLLARTGDHAPGTASGVHFARFFRQPVISDSGKVAFLAALDGPGVDTSNNDGLWTEGNGSLALLIRESVTPVPGAPGVFGNSQGFNDPNPRMWPGMPAINATGRVAQRAFTTDPSPFSLGIYTDRSGTLELVARTSGAQVAGLEPRQFANVGVPVITDDGVVAFLGFTTTPFPQFGGIWTDRSGSLAPIVLSGDPAPGTSGAFTTLFALYEGINAAGRIAFMGWPSGGDGFDTGIWSEGTFGVIQPIAQSGALAPGTSFPFFSFSQVENPVVSDTGVTAFAATIDRAFVNRGVWSNRSGSVELVALAGGPVPSVPGSTFSDFFHLAINADGQAAMFASTTTGGALCRQAVDGTLETVVSAFTPLDLFGDGSDVRLITEIVMPEQIFIFDQFATGSSGGRRTYFNDSGALTLRMKLSTAAGESEGIFIAGSPTPCPADLDGDNVIGLSDLAILLANFGTADGATPEMGDLDNDGDVDLTDLAVMLGVFGTNCPA